MSNKTQLPVEVLEEIKQMAQLSTDFLSNDETLSKDYLKGYKTGWGYGGKEYATKLHEAQQENERLKAIANLWRPLMEEAISQDSLYGHVPIETINKIKRFLYGE